MKSLEYGRVEVEQLKVLGAVTLIHGGAGPVSEAMELSNEAQAACLSTLESASERARAGQKSLELPYPGISFRYESSVAETQALGAVLQLEASPSFNSGFGAALQRDGRARVTAAFMESTRRRLSALINAENIKHPSLVACYLQGEVHGVRDLTGSQLLLRELGIPCEELVTPQQFKVWAAKRLAMLDSNVSDEPGTGTVGSVSCDCEGRLAAVTSTGGTGFEAVGRVGDVATVAGTYCTSRTAVSCTGYGEEIVSQALAARLAVRLEDSNKPEFAIEQTLLEAEEHGCRFAFICVHKTAKGILWARGATTERFVWGLSHHEGIVFKNAL